mgnify:CR=1 FL=1
MKKLFALLLALMMVFALAACGNNETPSGSEGDKPGTSQGGESNNGGESTNNGDNNTETYDLTTVAGYLAQYGYSESDFSSTKNFTRMKSTSTKSSGEIVNVGVYISEGLTEDEKTAWVDSFITLAESKSDDGKVYKYDYFNGIQTDEIEPAVDFATFGGVMAYKADGKTVVVELSITNGVDSDDPDDAMSFANIGFEFE